MKYSLFAAVFCLLFASFVFAQTDEINIIPKPQSISLEEHSNGFIITRKTKIVIESESIRAAAVTLNDALKRNYGFTLVVTTHKQKENVINIGSAAVTDHINPEGYTYRSYPLAVWLGGGPRGLFYAVQTLLQLIRVNRDGSLRLPKVDIFDAPRFAYRGMHLDVGRHFMPVEFVKKYIDLMSQYKFNYFHWHLTEDQGWRIEIKKYPKLTEIGSIRKQSRAGRYADKYVGDGTPYGGFYTQEQIKDIVAYAKARYITVIPEIEMPGHSVAALAAYPNLGRKEDASYEVFSDWGITNDIYCPKDETFAFLEDVLTEVFALFPDSPYVHIGGDEAPKKVWKESQFVQDLEKREGLKDENEVQSYFIQRMEKFINSKGKKIIGWDEILEGGLAPNATVMSWRGIKGGIEAAKSHHDVIMTPTDYAYFDYGQGDPATEPLNIGGYLPLEKVYSFDPVPKELTADEAKYIIGGQGNIWTEYLPTPASVEYMAFPRMLALAEDVWSTPENKNFADFSRRLAANFARLDKQNVNYRIPEPTGLHNMVLGSDENVTVDLKPSINGARIYYTVDGSTPDERSTRYEKPIDIDVQQNQRVDLKTVTVLQSGRKSSIYTATILRRDYQPAVELSEKRAGVTYGLSMLADGEGSPIVASGETKILGLQQFASRYDLKRPFSLAYDGYINVPIEGIYEFQVESSRDAAVYVGGEKLIDIWHVKDTGPASNVVPLRAGLHKISLRYANSGRDPFFRVRWGIKGQGLRVIGGGELVH